MNKKTKILAYMDSPECFSGFGQVARNILSELHKTGDYEIVVFGINQPPVVDSYGLPRQSEYPFTLIQASYVSDIELLRNGGARDPYGKEKLLKYMFENEFDIFFTIQDPFVVEFLTDPLERLRTKHGRKFQTVFYFPIDADNIPAGWINTAHSFDHPVVYSEYGYKQLKERVQDGAIDKFHAPIPHGTNVKDFFPLGKKERDELRASTFGDRFVVLNVGRNQPRKDPCRSLAVFAEFKRHVPDAVYLYHCNPHDVGNNLIAEAKYYGLKVNRDLFFPVELMEGKQQGLTLSQVNDHYNMADVLISTTLGEGWGLSTTEAMATKLPLVVPRNTATIEIVGEQEERGYLADSGNHINLWQVNQAVVDEPPRPLTSIPSMVEKMLQVYKDRTSGKYEETETFRKAEAAFLYAQNNTWDSIVKERWLPIFKTAADKVREDKLQNAVNQVQ